MQNVGDCKLPPFFNYSPYFTLQPVKDTQDKQIQLWKSLILDYCKSQKVFVIGLEDDFPLFSNSIIQRENNPYITENLESYAAPNLLPSRLVSRHESHQLRHLRNLLRLASHSSLSHEAKMTFLSALVSEGRAEWMDKGHRKCLILWNRIQDWADSIVRFVKDNGLEDSIMTVEEIRTGIESRGTELHGMDRTVLMRALKLLENKGKLAVFKGASTDDEGVKFSL